MLCKGNLLHGPSLRKTQMNNDFHEIYTAESVLQYLESSSSMTAGSPTFYEKYYAKLTIGQPPTWKCDQRTKELFCLYAWLMDELTMLQCSDEDRRAMQWYFNRKSRAEDDLFALTAKVMNNFLAGNIDKYRGK